MCVEIHVQDGFLIVVLVLMLSVLAAAQGEACYLDLEIFQNRPF